MRGAIISILAGGLAFALACPAQAGTIVAQQPADYKPNNNGHPDTIGSGTWKYMYSSDMNPTLGTTGLLMWVGTGYYVASGDWYPDVEMAVAPYKPGLTIAPEVGGAPDKRYGVMRWTSGVAGTVNVAGTWEHFWNMGDGMDIAIYVNGVQGYSAFLTSGSAAFSFDAVVAPGSLVDYVVGPGASANGNYDRAYIATTVTLSDTPMPWIPEPLTMVGLLFGLAGTGAYVRRRTAA